MDTSQHLHRKEQLVKRAMYVVMVLVVLLLPSLGHSQERSGNNTVPYTLWLPVVEMAGCPYEASNTYYSFSYVKPTFEYVHKFYISSEPEQNFHETGTVGEIVISRDAAGQQVVRQMDMEITGEVMEVLWAWLPKSVLEEGSDYYWKLRFVCPNGTLSKWSDIYHFVAVYH